MVILYFKGPAKIIGEKLNSFNIPFKNIGSMFILNVDIEKFLSIIESFPPDITGNIRLYIPDKDVPLNMENLISAGFNSISLDEFLENYLFWNLSQILSNSQVHFQAIIDTKTKGIYGFEALSRLSIPIYKLFRISDRISLLTDNYCRENALLEFARIFSRTFSNYKYHLFLNFHPKFLKNPLENVGELIMSLVSKNIEPSTVVVEIDEYEGMDTKSIKLIREFLKAEGVKVALDDLGAGYSGLYQLTEIHPDIAKLDMSLIRDVHKHPIKQSVLAGLVMACKSAGIKVLAEGVETMEELKYLISLDIDLLQGFLFAKPEPYPNIREIEDLARKILAL